MSVVLSLRHALADDRQNVAHHTCSTDITQHSTAGHLPVISSMTRFTTHDDVMMTSRDQQQQVLDEACYSLDYNGHRTLASDNVTI